MKIGVFSHINGNYSRLESILGNMNRKKVDQIYCLGNLIGNEAKKNGLSNNDCECAFLMKAYQYEFKTFYALRGINEEEYLQNSEGNHNPRNNGIRYFIAGFHPNQFMIDNGFAYGFIFDGFGTKGRKESRKLINEKDSRFNYLLRDSKLFNRHTKILFLGDNQEQEAYVKEKNNINKKVFKSDDQMILPINDPNFLGAVISPSSKENGYMILEKTSLEVYQ